MVSLEELLKKAVKGVKSYLRYRPKVDDGAEQSVSFLQLSAIKEQVDRRTPHRKKVKLDELPRSQVWLYRLGFAVVLGVLLVSFGLFALEGGFQREWINPYATASHGATTGFDSNELAVAMFAAMGIPPFVIYIALGVLLLGWLLMLVGLQAASPLYFIPFLAVLTGQLWLLWGGIPLQALTRSTSTFHELAQLLSASGLSLRLTVPLVFGVGHLCLCLLGWLLGERKLIRFLLGVGHLLLLSLFGLGLLSFSTTRMQLMVGLSAAQVSTILMLALYWYLLGRDALDGALTLAHWYGHLGMNFLRSHLVTLLSLALIIFGSVAYLNKSSFYTGFSVVVWVGVAFVLVQWLLLRRPPDLLAVNVLLLSLVTLVIAPKAFGAFVTTAAPKKALLFLSPIAIFIYATIWGFYASRPLFINRATPRFGRNARLFVHLGWVLLASNCLMFFVAARDDMFMFLSAQITAEAFLIVGLPVFLFMLGSRPGSVLVQPLQAPDEAKEANEADEAKEEALQAPGASPANDPNATAEVALVIASTPGDAPLDATAQAVMVLDEARDVVGDTPRPAWRWALFCGFLALALLVSVQLVRGLAVVTYARVAWRTAEANIALRKGRHKLAIKRYNQAIAVMPKNYKPYSLRGLSEEKLGWYKAAIRSLRLAVKHQPRAPDAWQQLGTLYRTQKQYKLAAKAYQKALLLDPSDSFVYRHIGLCYAHQKQFGKAMENMAMALKLQPGNNEFGMNHYAPKAFVLMLAGKNKEALVPLRRALALNAKDHLALFDMGVVMQRLGQLDKALFYLQRSHKSRPDKLSTTNWLVPLLWRLTRARPKRRKLYQRLLIQAYQRAHKASPDDVRLTTRYVKTLIYMRRFSLAEKLLASQATPLPLEVALLWPAVLLAKGAGAAAQKKVDVLRKAHPKSLALLRVAIRVASRQKQVARAKPLVAELLQRVPTDSFGLTQLAYFAYLAKEYRKAIPLYARVVKLHPKLKYLSFFAAKLAVQKLRDYPMAFGMYHRLLHGQKDRPTRGRILALRYYGLSGMRMKPPRLKASLDAYQRILRLTGGKDTKALRDLLAVYGAARAFDKQVAVLDKLIALQPKALLYRLERCVSLQKARMIPEAKVAFTAFLKRLDAIPDALYRQVYKRQMKGYAKVALRRYCVVSLKRLQGHK